MRKHLYSFYLSAQRMVAPGLRNSQFVYKQALESHCQSGLTWMDLGCGHQLLPSWMPSSQESEAALLRKARLFVGIDADTPSLRKNKFAKCLVAGNIERLPFSGEVFDLVTANMVLEHVRQPAELLREVHRVLKPHGQFLFPTPNSWGYTTQVARLLPQRIKTWLVRLLQQREESDVFPTHYRFNSARSIGKLAREIGFDVTRLSLVESSAQTAMLGPLVVFELAWIRATRWRFLSLFRTNLIVVLEKSGPPQV
jgi:ubiquinone/menaquinone biosynthesis C-methylase UbiE